MIGRLAQVDMRIGLVGNEDLRQRAHAFRHVGVQVEGDRDRQIRADDGAQALQQFAFAVIRVFGHHGAVQAEQDAVEFFRLGSLDDLAGQEFIGFDRHRAGRLGPGADRMAHVPAEFPLAHQSAGEAGIRLAALGDRFVGEHQRLALELGNAGLANAERVGFVHELGSQNFKRHSQSPVWWVLGP